MHSILLVEDDEKLAKLIADFLQQNQFHVEVVSRGDIAISQIIRQQPDLVILDINLPGQDGFSVCRAVRPQFNKPILFLTARDSDFDHVTGLEIGADDYLIKPIEPHVLLARLHSILRRCHTQPVATTSNVLQFGGLIIDKQSHKVSLAGERVELTSHEFELLALLAEKPGEVQTREYVHKKMIGREYDGLDRSVDVRISRLRKKLNDDLKSPYRIVTVWGKGYLFSATAWDE